MKRWSWLVALGLASCAASLPEVAPERDPANPDAVESAPAPVSTTLAHPGQVAAEAPNPPPVSERSPAASSMQGPPREEAHAGRHHGGGAMDMGAKPDAGGAEKPSPAATVYTCPMHPEVTSDRPGRCPKCGMKLVPRAPTDGGAP